MNPFYGSRKPAKQRGDSLMHVSDIMVTGIAIVTEALSLIEYLKVNNHLGMFGPFGVTGISMGGHMAGLTGGVTNYNFTSFFLSFLFYPLQLKLSLNNWTV